MTRTGRPAIREATVPPEARGLARDDVRLAVVTPEATTHTGARHLGEHLRPGDLLVVDNHACIHGRSAYPARYDGTDRWLQRSFVVESLAPSAPDRRGRIIDTTFT